jgi:glycine/D-amino acid oxidase-like deaminating enzyme
MMIETPVYLNSLMQDYLLFGGKLKIREFNSLTEINSLAETVVMNCTGLGSQKLFKDETLVPVRGQLCVLLPQPEIKYSYATGDHENILYMFPRKDGIILGGTFDKGNWSLEPDKQVTERILSGHSIIAKSIGG